MDCTKPDDTNLEHLNSLRYTSVCQSLTRDTLALILAGGQGSRLYELTNWRAKPALYFGGKYRIIDFALSNCLNSGIRRIGVLTQYKAHSLIRHLVHGWSWFQAGGARNSSRSCRHPSASVVSGTAARLMPSTRTSTSSARTIRGWC